MERMIIWDCRHKEFFEIKRVGGDLEISAFNEKGKETAYWFAMKKPANQTFKKIEKHFEEIQKLLERQEE
jgi:hypothetical protein